VRLLQVLQDTDIETHLVLTDSAKLTMAAETDFQPAHVQALADVVHASKNVGATIASGSFVTLGMDYAVLQKWLAGSVAASWSASGLMTINPENASFLPDSPATGTPICTLSIPVFAEVGTASAGGNLAPAAPGLSTAVAGGNLSPSAPVGIA
jgi:hypothetical protein